MMAASLNLPARFREFVNTHNLIARHDRIVVAVSGGVDSRVLLHLLAGERTRWEVELLVAHFNHQLRGEEADADEAFVGRLAAHYDVPFHAGRGRVGEVAASRGIGIEEAARSLRYSFLEETRRSKACTRIATGHNADDNTETVLLNLFRGAGVRGLAGIPVSRTGGTIIRPLLFAAREDILSFATAAGLEYRDDSSNATDAHARNILRHHVLPVIKERIQPDVTQTVLRTSALFRELDAYVTQAARTALGQVVTRRSGEEVHLSLPLLLQFPAAVQSALLVQAVVALTGVHPGFKHTERLHRLCASRTGARIGLGAEWQASRLREEIRIGKKPSGQHFAFNVRQDTPYTVPGGVFRFSLLDRAVYDRATRPSGEYVDADRTGQNGLVLRSWERGDWFVPLGMQHKKKLSDLFVDAGIPAHEKHRYPVLSTATGEIVWVCGLRIDERFKVTDSTRHVLQLQFTREIDSAHEE